MDECEAITTWTILFLLFLAHIANVFEGKVGSGSKEWLWALLMRNGKGRKLCGSEDQNEKPMLQGGRHLKVQLKEKTEGEGGNRGGVNRKSP